MRIGYVAIVGMAAAALGVGCEEGTGGTGLGLVAAPASYRATMMVFENEAGLAVDLVEDGGLFELSLDEQDGTFRSSFRYDAIDIDVSGTYEIEADRITFSDDPFEADDLVLQRSFAYATVGDTLVLGDAASVFDVDGDGEDEVAALELWLEPI